MMKFARVILLVVFTAAATALSPRAETTVPPRAAATVGVEFHRDLPYETIDGVPIKLDVAVPTAGDGPFPLILCIHGGAWRIGDKWKFNPMIEDLARHGYVAASINYRFAPRYKYPAQLDDTKAALLFLKQHARQFKIDVNKVGATGESSGAHLAMMMAFQAAEQKNVPPVKSTRLAAIVNYYGPVDLTNWSVAPLVQFMWQRQFHERLEDSMLNFLGSNEKDGDPVKAASPINYVTKHAPPILTFHGTLDPMVPFHQAELLRDALKKNDVPEQLVPIENGLHGGWAPAAKRTADDEAIAWFDKYLKGSPDPLPQFGAIAPDGSIDHGAASASTR
jgi:acetyl esterase/lipase